MTAYIVLYRDAAARPADPPLAFRCSADDVDHAEEQVLNAYGKDTDVVWVVDTDNVRDAYADYYAIDPTDIDL